MSASKVTPILQSATPISAVVDRMIRRAKLLRHMRRSIGWRRWIETARNSLRRKGISQRSWAALANVDEATLRRAVRGEPGTAFGTVDSLLATAGVELVSRTIGKDGGAQTHPLRKRSPLRHAARLTIHTAQAQHLSGMEWARRAGTSERTVRRFKNGETGLGMDVFGQLLSAANVRVVRPYRGEHPVVVVETESSFTV